MTRHLPLPILTAVLTLGPAAQGLSQELSSSLYNTGDEYFADPFAAELGQPAGPPTPGMQTVERRLSPAIAAASFSAVTAPEPRTFAVHDLVTIIVREEAQTSFSSKLETEKETSHTGEIAEFPRLTLSDLIDFQLIPNTFPNGTLKVDVKGGSEFTGEGDFANRQTMTARLQATIIDVKPNGNVVLEARKSVQDDGEQFELVATGICRVDDITATNTVLSSQLADLYIDKQSTGHLRKAANKGLFTEVLDFFFRW